MYYLGWDVGIKNLSYCLLDSDKNIIDWNIIDLTNKVDYYCEGEKKGGQVCGRGASYYYNNKCYCRVHSKKISNCKEIYKCIECGKNSQFRDTKGIAFYCTKHNKPNTIQIINVKNVAKFPLQQIGSIMYEKLDAIPKLLEASVVVIENQPVLKNPTMKSVQILLYSYFLLKNKNVQLHFISASSKLKFKINTESIKNIKSGKKTKYQKNKLLGIEYCEHFIGESEFFKSHKKRDDLADSYLLTRYFIEKK